MYVLHLPRRDVDDRDVVGPSQRDIGGLAVPVMTRSTGVTCSRRMPLGRNSIFSTALQGGGVDDVDDAGELARRPRVPCRPASARSGGAGRRTRMSLTTCRSPTSMTWTRFAASEATKTRLPSGVTSTPFGLRAGGEMRLHLARLDVEQRGLRSRPRWRCRGRARWAQGERLGVRDVAEALHQRAGRDVVDRDGVVVAAGHDEALAVRREAACRAGASRS